MMGMTGASDGLEVGAAWLAWRLVETCSASPIYAGKPREAIAAELLVCPEPTLSRTALTLFAADYRRVDFAMKAQHVQGELDKVSGLMGARLDFGPIPEVSVFDRNGVRALVDVFNTDAGLFLLPSALHQALQGHLRPPGLHG